MVIKAIEKKYYDPDTIGCFPAKMFKMFAHVEMTSLHVPPSRVGGWIGVWKRTRDELIAVGLLNKSYSTEISCSVVGCENKTDIIGAHMRYMGSVKAWASWYIIPTCKECNKQHGQGTRIRTGTLAVKIMQGSIFGANKILIGTLNFTGISSENNIPFRSYSWKYAGTKSVILPYKII